MELTTFFMAAVAFICVTHLATSISKPFRKKNKASYQAASRTRSDWYCFFSRADLYGHVDGGVSSQHLPKHSHASQNRRANQQASRPRLYK